MSLRLLFVVAICAQACKASPITRPPFAAPSDADVYAVYSEVIDSVLLGGRSLPIAVVDTTTFNPPLRLQTSGPLSAMLDSAAPGLREALATAVQTRVPLRPAFSLPGRVMLVPRSAVFLSGDSPRTGPEARYVIFSAVGFSPDGQRAAVYAEYHCGGLCGGGYVIVLARQPQQSWQIRRVHTNMLF